jgi:hypothetical protein
MRDCVTLTVTDTGFVTVAVAEVKIVILKPAAEESVFMN